MGKDSFGDLGLAPDPDGMVCADFLDELVLRPGLGEVIDLESMFFEGLYSLLADIFDQE